MCSVLLCIVDCSHIAHDVLLWLIKFSLSLSLSCSRGLSDVFVIVADSHSYGRDDYEQISLRTWVNVVCGKVTAIDRYAMSVCQSADTQVCSLSIT